MLALGVILVLLAAAAILAAVFGGAAEPLVFELGAFNVTTNTFTVFVTGALTVLVLVVGLGLIRAGLRRARQRRHEKKELNRLAHKLEQREAAEPGTAGGAPTKTPAVAGTGSPDTRPAPVTDTAGGTAPTSPDTQPGATPDAPGSHRSTS